MYKWNELLLLPLVDTEGKWAIVWGVVRQLLTNICKPRYQCTTDGIQPVLQNDYVVSLPNV